MRHAAWLFLVLLLVPSLQAEQTLPAVQRDRVQFWIPAVGQASNGTLFGVASSLEVVQQRPGTGQVFISTQPLTEVDMQGSARLALETAGAVTGRPTNQADYFITVRTSSVTIGGPSAGGALAVAVAALLLGRPVDDHVVMTGMINPDGSIGPVGGILQKVDAAASVGATRFLVPLGQSVVATAQGPVDARAYARDRYGIQLDEAADLYDAVGPFVGLELVRPLPQSNPLQGAAYQNLTAELAQNLTQAAEGRAQALPARYQAVRSQMSNAERNAAEQQLATANARIASARDAANFSKHYQASSFAFQSLVASAYADALIGFFEASTNSATAYARTYLDQTDAHVAARDAEIRRAYPLPAAQLDAHAAAEQRIQAALDTQSQARARLQAGSIADALQGSSFARERASSAAWWARIGDTVAQDAPQPLVNRSQVQTLLERYLETVDLQLQYAAHILPRATDLDAARDARRAALDAAQRGRIAGATFSLLEAMARTSTALVSLAGTDAVRQRLDALADAAAYQIELAQGHGAPPVYAISLFELADSQVISDPGGAYQSYSLARIGARTSLQAAGVTEPPATTRPIPGPSSSAPDETTARFVLVAFALIALVVLAVAASTLRRAPNPAPPKHGLLPPPSESAPPPALAPPPTPAPPEPSKPQPPSPAEGPKAPRKTPRRSTRTPRRRSRPKP